MNQMFFYQSPNVERADYVCGIQLIPNSPQLDNAPLVYFTDTEIASRRHATKVETLFSDVMNKFVPKYKGIFSADFIQKWAVWKECKLQRWNTISESARSERMVLPQPCALRQPHFNHFLNHHNLEDSVPADMGDEIELVCFNSGVMAVFQRPQKRDVLHHIIADEEELFASTKPVFLNQVCIFKYVYPNKLSGEEVAQISVGQIVNMYEDDPASPSQAFDIRFFPPRCAKPQTSKRPDTLYQNINASMGT